MTIFGEVEYQDPHEITWIDWITPQTTVASAVAHVHPHHIIDTNAFDHGNGLNVQFGILK